MAVGPRSPSRSRAAQEQHGAKLVGGIGACAMIVGIVVVMAIQLTRSHEIRSANVIADFRDDPMCRQQTFDNQTAYLAATERPCRNPAAFDVNELPPPAGTIHRLEGISKSFSSR
jgi:hypothetical protein